LIFGLVAEAGARILRSYETPVNLPPNEGAGHFIIVAGAATTRPGEGKLVASYWKTLRLVLCGTDEGADELAFHLLSDGAAVDALRREKLSRVIELVNARWLD
jgi:hypothetical protein